MILIWYWYDIDMLWYDMILIYDVDMICYWYYMILIYDVEIDIWNDVDVDMIFDTDSLLSVMH